MDTLGESVTSYYNSTSTTTKLIVVGTTLLLFIKWLTGRNARLPPGPFALPIIGNLLSLRKRAMEDVMNNWKRKYGPIFTYYLGPMRIVAVTDIDIAVEALTKRGSDFSGRPFIYSLSLVSEGCQDIANASYSGLWKFQRKVTAQALRQYLIGDQLEKRVHEVTQTVIQNMEKEKGPIDMHMHMSLSVFNMIHGICFGNKLDFEDPNFLRMVRAFDTVREAFVKGFMEDLIPPLRLWPTKRFSYTMGELQFFNDYVYKRMDEHRIRFNRDDLTCLVDNVIQAERQLQVEDTVDGKHFTRTHSAMICVDVFGGGLDTTRVTLDWIFLVLIKRPEIQDRIRKEIDAIVGEKIPGREHRSKLVYTEAVIFEALRLYAPAPFGLLHQTMCDTAIGGYQIPRKTAVMFSLTNYLRDPKYWEDPLSFKPERFLDETQSKVVMHNKNFIPFSLGHRSCPGESLAKMEILYIVVGLLQKFTFSMAPGYEDIEPITLIHGFTNETPVYKVTITQR